MRTVTGKKIKLLKKTMMMMMMMMRKEIKVAEHEITTFPRFFASLLHLATT